MQNRAFIISVGIAVFAVLLVDSYVTSSIDAVKHQHGREHSVVVASRDIKELEVLDERNLTFKPVPEKFAEPGTSERIEDFKGALAVAPIQREEQVTRTKVTMAGIRPGLARQISSGKRAVTIKINDETGLAKLLKPGDRVDVAATIDPSGSGNKLFLETRVILQDRLVLATGKYVTNSVPGILEVDPWQGRTKSKVPLGEYMGYATVTLEVDPSQVTTLVYAARNLDVYLVLKNNDDSGSSEDFGKTTMKDFTNTQPPAAKAGPSAALPVRK